MLNDYLSKTKIKQIKKLIEEKKTKPKQTNKGILGGSKKIDTKKIEKKLHYEKQAIKKLKPKTQPKPAKKTKQPFQPPKKTPTKKTTPKQPPKKTKPQTPEKKEIPPAVKKVTTIGTLPSKKVIEKAFKTTQSTKGVFAKETTPPKTLTPTQQALQKKIESKLEQKTKKPTVTKKIEEPTSKKEAVPPTPPSSIEKPKPSIPKKEILPPLTPPVVKPPSPPSISKKQLEVMAGATKNVTGTKPLSITKDIGGGEKLTYTPTAISSEKAVGTTVIHFKPTEKKTGGKQIVTTTTPEGVKTKEYTTAITPSTTKTPSFIKPVAKKKPEKETGIELTKQEVVKTLTKKEKEISKQVKQLETQYKATLAILPFQKTLEQAQVQGAIKSVSKQIEKVKSYGPSTKFIVNGKEMTYNEVMNMLQKQKETLQKQAKQIPEKYKEYQTSLTKGLAPSYYEAKKALSKVKEQKKEVESIPEDVYKFVKKKEGEIEIK
ncbi:MAG: hypothetical protein ACTSWZ_05850, partial [Candidatus Heimdallarchaeaceae archaeon]